MLQDLNLMKKSFHDCPFVFNKNKAKCIPERGEDSSLGKVFYEEVGHNYYQCITPPVKILNAPKSGTVGQTNLIPIKKGDFLILHNDTTSLGYLHQDRREFAAQLCDDQGSTLSATLYYPGDVLPISFKSNTVSILNCLSIFSDNNVTQEKNAPIQKSAHCEEDLETHEEKIFTF
ncbi:MAG: hypothetical protein QM652_09275 [Legionella sp.]|uniref:hypothetical protein n=1 Tax=Legionella sp. TaxID=459 RepID=UPI0039E37FE7